MSSSSKWSEPIKAFEYPSVLSKAGLTSRPRTEDSAANEARIREQAVRDAETALREQLERTLSEERKQIHRAVTDFAGECETYYRRVEGEVVQLSLAIARRILYREAEVDPLMLAGVVRVALDTLRAATEIRLHVCPAHAAAWRQMFERNGDACKVAILEEPLFAASQCRLESSLGVVELGVDDQLKEIEHGFFDLLAARPR